MHGKQPAPDFPAGISHVCQTRKGSQFFTLFVYLFAIHQDPVTVHPVPCKRFSSQSTGNCDFIFVVGKNQLAATGVDIISFPEIFHCHGNTLNVPWRTYIAPVGFSEYSSFQFRKSGSFKKRKVSGIILFIFIKIYGGTQFYLVDIDAGQTAIIGKARDIEVQRSQFLICISFFHQFFSQRNHIVNMLACFRVFGGRFNFKEI